MIEPKFEANIPGNRCNILNWFCIPLCKQRNAAFQMHSLKRQVTCFVLSLFRIELITLRIQLNWIPTTFAGTEHTLFHGTVPLDVRSSDSFLWLVLLSASTLCAIAFVYHFSIFYCQCITFRPSSSLLINVLLLYLFIYLLVCLFPFFRFANISVHQI